MCNLICVRARACERECVAQRSQLADVCIRSQTCIASRARSSASGRYEFKQTTTTVATTHR